MYHNNVFQGSFDPFQDQNHPFIAPESNPNHVSQSSSSSQGCFPKETGPVDYATLNWIDQTLMEDDDLENSPCMLQDSLALQATERSFYEVLGQIYSPDENHQISDSLDENLSRNISSVSVTNLEDLNRVESLLDHQKKSLKRNNFENSSEGDRGSIDQGKKPKQFVSSNQELADQSIMFDEVFCPQLNYHLNHDPLSCNKENTKVSQYVTVTKHEELTTLLIDYAQAISIYDFHNIGKLRKKIRLHSSPDGDGYERAAYYFANALEARVLGTGTTMYTDFPKRSQLISAAELLKGYKIYVKACPFDKMSNLFANRSIIKVAQKATKIHIIDLGITYGFQYPSLIQHLSKRLCGAPKLRITGIDFPQPGFRPAQRIEETGRELASCCERFKVPFEYTAITKKWETIELNELNIGKDEVVVVNCLYHLRYVSDETLLESSPRDAVLNLVRRINPDIFIHGILNGSYNDPNFLSRFRSALSSFFTRFDMFDVNVSKEEQGRMLFEREIYGRDIMNVVAYEGSERVERPETYHQMQMRNERAGLRQMELEKDIVKSVRALVKANYHKDYVVDEDSNWLLQGWKGAIIYAISCWKPAN